LILHWCNVGVGFDIASMDQEMEMCVRPASEVDQKKKIAEAGADIERNKSVTTDGKPRTRLQMVAILTALFVRGF
jgi:hypothetical protein